jgi:RES domain-containing protein
MDVETTSISGIWWRHIPGGGDVHYQPDPPADSRWQRGEVVDALYFAEEEETAWAEWYRALAETGLPPQQWLPRDLWRWELSLPHLADLSSVEKLAAVGLPRPEPQRSQWPDFQKVGAELFAEGLTGILCPSATRPGSLVICLFRPERIVPGTTPVPPPKTYEEAPVVPRGMTT